MASPSQPFSLSLSLDSSLKPFLSGRHCHLPTLSFAKQPPSLSSLQCSPTPQTPQQIQEPTQITPQSFLSPTSLSKLQTLCDFSHTHHFSHGTLQIRRMFDTEIDAVSNLLSESFVETLFFPPDYAKLLAFLVKNYLLERRALVPHTTLLVGFYRSGDHVTEEQDAELACTAEISFNERGANAAAPTPTPPPECPYICNMTVKNSLRRKGLGKQLLRTCEDLISKMTDKRDVYLHCRMVDKVPLRMYKKAGYQVVRTDSFLVWLTLQRRKHLMRKQLHDVTESEAPKQEL